jgi:hypothetical protein
MSSDDILMRGMITRVVDRKTYDLLKYEGNVPDSVAMTCDGNQYRITGPKIDVELFVAMGGKPRIIRNPQVDPGDMPAYIANLLRRSR